MADPELFYFDPVLRESKRAQLNISENEAVFIYTGGFSSYQQIPEMLSIFETYWKKNSFSRFIFLSPDPIRAKKIFDDAQFPWIVETATLPDVNAWLNAADYGFLLRKKDPLNTAASPTKFAEYALTGLKIIMTDAVPDSYALAKNVGISCDPSKIEKFAYKPEERSTLATRMAKILSPAHYRAELMKIYLWTGK
jgi:hypothetical protein